MTQPALFATPAPPAPPPATLLDHLQRHTVKGTARNARLVRCRECRAHVLIGLDADECAAMVRADPYPLNPAGEAHAWLTGATTYRVHITTERRPQLTRRTASNITDRPAGTVLIFQPADIVTDHHCGRPPPDHHRQASTIAARHHQQPGPDAPAPY